VGETGAPREEEEEEATAAAVERYLFSSGLLLSLSPLLSVYQFTGRVFLAVCLFALVW